MSSMEEICDILGPELDKQVRTMNTLPHYEFAKYLPLFQTEGVDKVGEDEYRDLCHEWCDRVSLYEKVDIIDPSYEGENKVIFSLPAMYSRLNTINHAGEGMERVADYFADTLIRDTRFTGEMVESLDMMVKAISAAQDPLEDRIGGIKEYVLLRARIEGKESILTENVDREDTSDFVWE